MSFFTYRDDRDEAEFEKWDREQISRAVDAATLPLRDKCTRYRVALRNTLDWITHNPSPTSLKELKDKIEEFLREEGNRN